MSNPVWTPNTPVAPGKVIVDPNGNIEQWSGTATPGSTGAVLPVFSNLIGTFTADGNGGWTCIAVLEIAQLPPALTALPIPVFVTDADGLNPQAVLSDMIAAFQNLSQRTLYPAQVEQLLINDYAYRESLVRNAIQWCGMQCLLAYSSYPMLDYLGQLVGVSRLPPQGASCVLQFTLGATSMQPLTIAAGTLVGTQDGAFAFATTADLTIAAGALSATVFATATTTGMAGNNYPIGSVSVQLRPNAQIAAVTNTTITSNGGDVETDDHLRERIQLAPNRFSVAGPSGAYAFWAFSADPSIVDVQITTPVPGTVDVWVLTGPVTQPAAAPNTAGIASAALLAKVLAVVNADTVRPLTDTVNVLAVNEVDYQVVATVTLYADVDPVTTMTAARNAAQLLAQDLANRIGRDVVGEEFIAVIGSVPGVYRVVLSQPAYTPLTAGQWANCTAIALTQVIGTEHS